MKKKRKGTFMEFQRVEIERCVKEHNIDRKRFFETSKQSYMRIIKRIEETFVEKSQTWKADIHWANMGNYKSGIPQSTKMMGKWEWIEKLPQIIPEPNKPVYVLFEDIKAYEPKYWLYECHLDALIVVLNECTLWGDFYIVSKKLNWLISLNHHDVISCAGEEISLDGL